MRIIVLAVTVAVLFLSTLSAQGQVVTYYYATWNYGAWSGSGIKVPPESLQIANVTHIVLFDNGNIVQTPPYCKYMVDSTSTALGARQELLYAANSNPGGWPSNPTPWLSRTVAAVHNAGAKLLLTVQAVDATNINYVAADSARTEVFANSFCQFAKRFGFDGLELDWEGWLAPFPANNIINRLVRILRRNMDAVWGGTNVAPLFISCGSQQYNTYYASQDQYVTSYVMQMYDFDQNYGGAALGCNVVWHISPTYRGSAPSGSEVRGWNTSGPAQWISAGHNPAKIGVLMPAYGTLYRGSSTIHTCYSSSSTSFSYVQSKALLNYGGTQQRDAARGDVPYIIGNASGAPSAYGLSNGTAFWMTYEDSLSYIRKMRYLDSMGVHNVGFYDITASINWSSPTKANRFPHLTWIVAGMAPPSPSIPSAMTNAASNITQTAATLNGNVNANGASATVRFVYGTMSGTYTDSVVADQSPVTGNFPVTGAITGLTANTTYYYRVRAYNSIGSAQGSEMSLTTNPLPTVPAVTTSAASSLTQTSVTLNGVVSANNASTTVRFVWGTTSGNYTDSLTASQSPVTGNSVGVNRTITGLNPNTTYYFRVRAYNSAGSAQGNQLSFTTQAQPVNPPATPGLVSPSNGATGIALPVQFLWRRVDSVTVYKFQLSTNSSFSTFVVNDSSLTDTTTSASSLSSGTTYYWRVAAKNNAGSSAFSATRSFTTMAQIAGLVAAYSFNEGSGTVLTDASGNGLNGQIQGATWSPNGRYGGALFFNGTSSYVDLGNPAALQMTGSMTIEAWINAAANPPDDGQIVAKSDNSTGWQFKTSPDTGPQTFGAAVSSGSGRVQRYSSATRSLNTWYHVASVYNTSTQTLSTYVNGVLNNGTLVGSVPSSQLNANVNANIGRRSGGYYFNGLIDEVRIYNRALSQAEIQSDMNTPIGVASPAGVFTVTPDSLPPGGGTVVLAWTSTGATSASINQGIGTVPLNGSLNVSVTSSTSYTLSLANATDTTRYVAGVVVDPGNQGGQDITAQGSPIALIASPTGNGNPDIEVIRDGVTPPVGSTNVMEQYATYDGSSIRPFDWVGFQFPSARSFSRLVFQEGIEFPSGGWFSSLRVQVRNGGQWTDVQNLVSTPAYTGANGVNFETFDFSFTPVSGDGIRLAGAPGGSTPFITVGELRVISNGSAQVNPPHEIPRDFSLDQNYPNPFNPSTRITFHLPAGGTTTLKIYNMLGQEMKTLVDGFVDAGSHTIDLDAGDLSNGVYLYALRTGTFSAVRKMILLK